LIGVHLLRSHAGEVAIVRGQLLSHSLLGAVRHTVGSWTESKHRELQKPAGWNVSLGSPDFLLSLVAESFIWSVALRATALRTALVYCIEASEAQAALAVSSRR
jgi:hypothetical protein